MSPLEQTWKKQKHKLNELEQETPIKLEFPTTKIILYKLYEHRLLLPEKF